jgi:nucleoside-diphosphate-sugar epimerase
VNVLIIGGNRFMGVGLTWRLLAASHRVTHFNRGSLEDPFGDRIERLRGDRTTPVLRNTLGTRSFDAVVDFAAFKGSDARDAVSLLSGRVGHYILISTGQVYLVRQSCPWPAEERDYEGAVMAKPSDPVDLPEWEYGVGKRDCEDVLQKAWEGDRFPATRLRIPMVDGERDNLRRLEGYIWRILDGGPVIVPDGGAKPVRHVYAGAVVRQIAALLGRPETFGRAYNLSQDEMPTLPELIGMLAGLIGAPSRVVPMTSDALRAARLDPRSVSPFSVRWMSCLDPKLAKAELGFQHEPLREYLGRIVASFLAHTPPAPPPSYAKRRDEIALAEARAR